MNARTFIIAAALLAFGALSVYAMLQVGYLGIWQAGIASWGGLQILVDLVIACAMICVWMVLDARERGANPWPFVVITVFTGSFGPLFYLLLRARRERLAGIGAA